jgi:site-specific DNA-methyltransferase (adenine-specific)
MTFEINYIFKLDSLYCGDNLKILSEFPPNSINFIYIDPPFFSNENYEIIWNDGYELDAFEDRWKGGIQHYLGWMKPRIEQLHRILNEEGSFFLHCDYHANGHLRVLCDKIFGHSNFRSEIIWRRTFTSKSTSKGIGRNLDTILYYTKSDKYTFNKVLIPLSKEQIERDYKNIENETGRRFTHNKMIKKGASPKTLVFKDKGKMTAKSGMRFVWNQETYERKIK